MAHQRAHIFLNGEMPDGSIPDIFIPPGEPVIAVDGGYGHLANLGLHPTILIGDLDSIDSDDLLAVEAEGIRIIRFASEKDQSDFELALDEALRLEVDQVTIYAALGGRIDHTLANLVVMSADKYNSLGLVLQNGSETIQIIKNSLHLLGMAGDIVSLIPWQGPVTGVQTTGLRYPLNNETLYPDSSRGLSNVFIHNEAVVSIQSGRLLCIHRSK